MGTNYYFYPKGFEKLDNINEITESTLNDMTKDYTNTIKRMIKDSIDKHSEYYDMFDLKTKLANLDDIRMILKYDVEIPELHICKLSAGWVPLFNKTKYYSNFDELENFYNKYKDILYLRDEYNKDITFEELKEKAYNKLVEKNSHLQYNNPYLYPSKNSYYSDDHGFEWTEIDDWS